ncbi:MAG TPA: ECF transporter S component [Bacillota bacterium]|nr:ECF transporter S component [Bacillota bacterium]HOP69348.1 ECF transporter S component [Bacillota bacterium]HPT34644.1 ECF transporter S component [Bacillota bacterium]HQD06209.1 ECF transporter S component [Bacillota bacterium]
MGRRFLDKFTMFDLLIVTMMAVLGVAIKPVVVPLAHIITGPLYVPGGVVAGGFYMLWIVLGRGLVGKTGAATLIGLVQALLVIVLGIFGTHGAASIITYLAPGVAVDLLYLLLRSGVDTPLGAFLGGVAANVTGTFMVNLAFFRLPWLPLVLGLSAAALSGGLGGLIAYSLNKQLKKYKLQSSAH